MINFSSSTLVMVMASEESKVISIEIIG